MITTAQKIVACFNKIFLLFESAYMFTHFAVDGIFILNSAT